MKQVELALKEKTGENNLFGVRLVDKFLGYGKGIKLTIPLGDDFQEKGKSLFKGAFSYYRNYAAHDGSKINEKICIRIMVLASELLDLIATSSISFTEIGGVEGLIKEGIFNNESQISNLLSFLSVQVCPYESFDGMFEELYKKGYTDNQFQSVFDLGLVEYKSEIRNHNPSYEIEDLDKLGWFELTTMGKKVVNQILKSS